MYPKIERGGMKGTMLLRLVVQILMYLAGTHRITSVRVGRRQHDVNPLIRQAQAGAEMGPLLHALPFSVFANPP